MLAEVERRKIEQALKETGGDRGRTAEILQVSYKTLITKLKEHGLERSVSFPEPDLVQRRLISFSVTSSTIVVAPMAVGSTKCSRPPTIFLSCCIASIIWLADTSAIGGSGPRLAIRSASAFRSRSARAPRSTRKLRGHQHPVGHRLAVTKPPVLGHRFERMPRGVAEVQNAPQAGLPLVGRDDGRP